MKKQIIQSVKIITLGVLAGLGLSYASAIWEAPGTIAGGDASNLAPLNTGTSWQTKSGGLGIGSLLVNGNIQVTGLGNNTLGSDKLRMACWDTNGKLKACSETPIN